MSNLYYPPTVIESNGKGERAYDLYSRLLVDRIIMVPEINQATTNSIVGQMLFLQKENPKDKVKMYINSPGGSILDGDGILDTMDMLKSTGIEIETTVIGKAASFGALILLNGTPGKRFVLPRSRVMIHEPRGGAQGTATDILIEARLIQDMQEEINQFIHERTKQPMDWVIQHTLRDSWFRGQKAVEAGLADRVIQPNEMKL